MTAQSLVNLTPHSITIRIGGEDGFDLVLPPDGTVARVGSSPGQVYSVPCTMGNGAAVVIPIAGSSAFGKVIGLPAPAPGVLFVVSAVVGAALARSNPERTDVVMPGTGPDDGCIRANGQIVAVTRLVRACAGI